MKINPRIYDLSDPEKMVEKQELENHIVEIYKLNDYPDLLEEFATKGKFAVWSSYDGRDYRLFVEEGFYNKLKPLYSKKVNTIWLGFWDQCELLTNKFKKIVMPLMVVVLLLMFLSSRIFKDNQFINSIAVTAIPVVFIAFTLTYRRITNKKVMIENSKSVEEIKKYLGANKFEQLLEAQRSYIDEYFKYEEESEDVEETKEETLDLFLETKDEEEASVSKENK